MKLFLFWLVVEMRPFLLFDELTMDEVTMITICWCEDVVGVLKKLMKKSALGSVSCKEMSSNGREVHVSNGVNKVEFVPRTVQRRQR